VYAEVSCGKDADTPNGPGEFWAEVDAIYWLKRDGTKGKEIPKSVYDRAEKYDYAFCDLIEQVFDHMRHEQDVAEGRDALATLALT
jgi:hypothetical protein